MIVLGGMVLSLMLGLYWMAGRVLCLYGVNFKSWNVRLLRVGIAAFVVFLCRLWRMAGLIVIHLIVIFAVTETAAYLVRAIWKHRDTGIRYLALCRIYRSGLIPVVAVCLLLGYGYYNMGRIVGTEYTIESDKLQGDYDIVLITDSHYDTIQNPDVLKSKIEEINDLKPDIVVLGGDIVEEGTSKQAMEEAFLVLGSLEAEYGVYYVYGNHDRQHYTDSRTYTEEELAQAIEDNGITILSDRWVLLGEDLLLAGREDASNPSGRLSSEELLKDADRNRFIIVADHQPIDAQENAAWGADLELAGHTHAGQIFPVGHFTEWSGMLNYGEYEEGGLRVVVSSGVTGWGFPVRTQGKCEYTVIHLVR